MRSRFDGDGNPDLKVVVAEYRDAMKKRVRWIGPVFGGILIALLAWLGTFTVNPGERGVVQTFGAYTALKNPGLHFIVPILQKYTIVNIEKVRREEIGFRTTQAGPKIVPAEAQMLTADENIVEVQMIVQYKIAEPEKYLFKLAEPEQTLHIAAEVALRDIVGQMKVTSDVDEEFNEDGTKKPVKDADLDILTVGRERAQERVKILLQKLLKLYESGITVTVVKLLPVDVPDEVKDAFHDVVRALEEKQQKINEARAYNEDKLPRAKGQAQKIVNGAEAYKRKRIAQAEGDAARFTSVLEQYKLARDVTRKRLHLETMERILHRVPKKVFIDKDVAKSTLPFLPIGDNAAIPTGGCEVSKTIAIAIALVLLIVATSSIIFVDETEYVLIIQFGKPKRTHTTAGVRYKIPFAETAIRLNRRILASDAPAQEYLSKDKKRLVADPVTRWRIVEPLKFYEKMRDELRAKTSLDDIVIGELRQELGDHDMADMVGSGRETYMDAVTQRVKTKATEYGIDVVDVQIKHLDLPTQVQQSVFNRMIAERKQLANKYRSKGQEESDIITSQTDLEQETILANANKTAETVMGEGDGEATRIYAEAYSADEEFFRFTRNLEAYEKSINENATVVMSTGSELFRYMTEAGDGTPPKP